jgi:hypothetical protein
LAKFTICHEDKRGTNFTFVEKSQIKNGLSRGGKNRRRAPTFSRKNPSDQRGFKSGAYKGRLFLSGRLIAILDRRKHVTTFPAENCMLIEH